MKIYKPSPEMRAIFGVLFIILLCYSCTETWTKLNGDMSKILYVLMFILAFMATARDVVRAFK
jgi:hypothetical protein